MRALVWEAPGVMTVQEQAEPIIQPHEVLIKVAYAGICGSELSGYLGHNTLRVPPLIMGHEFAGEVVALGSTVLHHNPTLLVGQRVTGNPLTSCGSCTYCARGLNHLCIRRTLIGAHRPGAYAEYVAVPAEQVVALPHGMDAQTGAITEPVAVAVRIGELAGPVAGADVLIIGAGPIGLLTLQILRLREAARVFVADLVPERLEMAAALGGIAVDARATQIADMVRSTTNGQGALVTVDAVGTATTRAQGVAATCSAGTLIVSGLHEEISTMPVADIIRRELVVRGCFCYSSSNFAEALDLLAHKAIHLDPWTVQASLADGGTWFDRLIAAPGNVAKVLLVP